jgi:hypothetical protein
MSRAPRTPGVDVEDRRRARRHPRRPLMIRCPDPLGPVAQFLRKELSRGAVAVSDLGTMARAAGLLGKDQRITHAGPFKEAKTALGIKSIRIGFGTGGRWAWLLDKQPAHPGEAYDDGQQLSGPASAPPDGHLEAKVEASAEQHSVGAASANRVPLGWTQGVALLDYRDPPTDVPPHRWRQFVEDCNNFLNSSENWAERAAQSGWEAVSLFGCRRDRPLEYLGRAGLLWIVNGGRLLELHRDWAVVELAVNGSRRVFDRRRLDAADVTLPWIGLRRHSG